ncbi:MAG: endonuclease III domain-containing protein [Nitrospinales bacterium]
MGTEFFTLSILLDNSQLSKVIPALKKAARQWQTPVVTQVGKKRDPFQVLVSCILSLRTRDPVTEAASRRLFSLAKTPKKLLSLDAEVIEKAIYPVAFYRNKTRSLRDLSRELLEKHGGRVPGNLEELLKLKGVGRKTANLTLILGFDGMGICVDTHVHRIANRWGYVSTRSADETEMQLRKKLPKKYWKEINDLLVVFG